MKIKDLLRISKPVTKILGPQFRSNLNKIEIDITFQCNLGCYNCDRSCRQAPSNDRMNVNQIKKFIEDSIIDNKKWNRIRILGGEPLTHPKILKILNLLIDYKKEYNPDVKLELVTNGFGKKVNKVLKKIPNEISVNNTEKTGLFQEKFEPFNLAPSDEKKHKFSDFTNACWITSYCGISLNRHGYYQCGVAGGIDRVLGQDIGLSSIPNEDQLNELKEKLCGLCGHFSFRNFRPIDERTAVDGEPKSRTWIDLYSNYNNDKPVLSEY